MRFHHKSPKNLVTCCSYFSHNRVPVWNIFKSIFYIFYTISTDNPICPFSGYDCLILIWQQIKIPFFISYVHPHFTIHNNNNNIMEKSKSSNRNEGTKKKKEKRLITQWTGHFLRKAGLCREREEKCLTKKSRFIFFFVGSFDSVMFRRIFLFYFIVSFHRVLCVFFLCIHTCSFFFVLFSGHPFKAWT